MILFFIILAVLFSIAVYVLFLYFRRHKKFYSKKLKSAAFISLGFVSASIGLLLLPYVSESVDQYSISTFKPVEGAERNYTDAQFSPDGTLILIRYSLEQKKFLADLYITNRSGDFICNASDAEDWTSIQPSHLVPSRVSAFGGRVCEVRKNNGDAIEYQTASNKTIIDFEHSLSFPSWSGKELYFQALINSFYRVLYFDGKKIIELEAPQTPGHFYSPNTWRAGRWVVWFGTVKNPASDSPRFVYKVFISNIEGRAVSRVFAAVPSVSVPPFVSSGSADGEIWAHSAVPYSPEIYIYHRRYFPFDSVDSQADLLRSGYRMEVPDLKIMKSFSFVPWNEKRMIIVGQTAGSWMQGVYDIRLKYTPWREFALTEAAIGVIILVLLTALSFLAFIAVKRRKAD